MFDAPCEAGRPARYGLPQQSPCQPAACAERGQRSALAARLGILLGLAYSQVRLGSSAAAISAIAPRRDQQRHVVVAFCFRDRESDRNHVEERRRGPRRARTREVVAHVETQFVTSDRQWPAADQRLIGAAVAIGCGARDHTLLAIGG